MLKNRKASFVALLLTLGLLVARAGPAAADVRIEGQVQEGGVRHKFHSHPMGGKRG